MGLDCQYFDVNNNRFRPVKANREIDTTKEIVVVLANLAGKHLKYFKYQDVESHHSHSCVKSILPAIFRIGNCLSLHPDAHILTHTNTLP